MNLIRDVFNFSREEENEQIDEKEDYLLVTISIKFIKWDAVKYNWYILFENDIYFYFQEYESKNKYKFIYKNIIYIKKHNRFLF